MTADDFDATSADASGDSTRRPARDPLRQAADARARTRRRWSAVLLSCVAASLVATIARVAQLKTAPEERLVDAMLHDDGTPIQFLQRTQLVPRGTIYDRRGQVVAMDVTGYRLFIDPRHVYREALRAAERAKERHARRTKDALEKGEQPPELEISLDPFGDVVMKIADRTGARPDAMLKEILDRVPASMRTLRSDATKEDIAKLPRYVVLDEELDDLEQEQLRGLRATGVGVEETLVRVYPFGKTAAQLVGIVGTDHTGLSGAEHQFNRNLDADPGRVMRLVDNRGQTIAVPAEGFKPGRPGGDVQLSIDMNIQQIVERLIDEVVRAANAGGGRAIVVDVETGEILAIYDVLRRNTGRSPIGVDPARDRNPAFGRARNVTDPFEPGSIFKPFVWAWITQLGTFRPESQLNTPAAGGIVVRDGRSSRLIRDVKYYGPSSWKKVLEKSMNAGMAIAAMRTSKAQMQECLRAFGFGQRTGCGLSGESPGIVPRPNRWTMVYTQCSVAIGQEISTTPVQLIRAFTAFCRDGSMVDLTLLRRAPGATFPTQQVLRPDIVAMSRDAMRGVLTEGTGRRAEKVARYEVFGKSGTAQLPSRTGYHQDRYMSSFIAAAPYDRPKIAVLVTIEDPDKYRLGANEYGGGALAGPVAVNIINEVLLYLGVPPDGANEPESVALAD
jgi:cell division protein FtsI (penicillin-binding protein 3)